MEKNDSIFQEQSLIENILISEFFYFYEEEKSNFNAAHGTSQNV